jgi:hypothetical protein
MMHAFHDDIVQCVFTTLVQRDTMCDWYTADRMVLVCKQWHRVCRETQAMLATDMHHVRHWRMAQYKAVVVKFYREALVLNRDILRKTLHLNGEGDDSATVYTETLDSTNSIHPCMICVPPRGDLVVSLKVTLPANTTIAPVTLAYNRLNKTNDDYFEVCAIQSPWHAFAGEYRFQLYLADAVPLLVYSDPGVHLCIRFNGPVRDEAIRVDVIYAALSSKTLRRHWRDPK